MWRNPPVPLSSVAGTVGLARDGEPARNRERPQAGVDVVIPGHGAPFRGR